MASAGQDLVQTPQAIHLKGFCKPGKVRMEPVGQTATHIKQPMHRDLLIITTPLLFTDRARVGQAATHAWHWLHTFISGGVELSPITMQDFAALSSLK